MNFVSFVTPAQQESWGVEDNGHFFDLGPTGLNVAGSLVEAIAQDALRHPSFEVTDAPSYPAAEVRYLPVIPNPGKILCVGVNYRTHQEETGKPAPAGPTVFMRYADSQMGHLEPAVFPAAGSQFDYEGELALVIGAPAYQVAAEDALEYVAGYAAYNDFSVRDWQRFSTQWGPGKNFPDTGSFGPWMRLPQDLGPIDALKLETRVNGEVRQSASLSDLIFGIPALIEFITTFTPLAPGDVIVTGTPGGVGLFMQPSGLLEVGDVVEVEITGLGVLRNEVTQG